MKTRALLILCFFSMTLFISSYAESLADRIGVCTSINNVPLLKASGYSYVEIGINSFLMPDSSEAAFSSNRNLAQISLLPVYSGNGFYPGTYRLTGENVDFVKNLNYGKTAIRRASEIGMKVLVLGSGTARNIPEGFNVNKAKEQFKELCDSLAKYAEIYNITIAVEPLRRVECNFINTVAEGAALAKEINNPHFGVLADFYHMMVADENPQVLAEESKWLKHCHIAEKQERTSPGSKGDDFTPFFDALRNSNYKGAISIECKWNDFEKELPRAIQIMREQINK